VCGFFCRLANFRRRPSNVPVQPRISYVVLGVFFFLQRPGTRFLRAFAFTFCGSRVFPFWSSRVLDDFLFFASTWSWMYLVRLFPHRPEFPPPPFGRTFLEANFFFFDPSSDPLTVFSGVLGHGASNRRFLSPRPDVVFFVPSALFVPPPSCALSICLLMHLTRFIASMATSPLQGLNSAHLVGGVHLFS